MKKKYRALRGVRIVEREFNYLPLRYALAALCTVLSIVSIIAIVVLLCIHFPLFYVSVIVMQGICVVKIVSSDDNPDYKVPWLLFVVILPVVGFMLYLLFASRKLKRKYVRRLAEARQHGYSYNDSAAFAALKEENADAHNQARLLCRISGATLFTDTRVDYYPDGEAMMQAMLRDLATATHFIYMEYFIIEEGVFWNGILEILKEKAAAGVEVKVLYDDVGCMTKLPGNYAAKLRHFGIEATPFSRLKGNADSEFNNRSHRKITVIDGKIGYTGGINLADEYINETVRFGYWKDTAVRLAGAAVYEMTKLFLIDFGLNARHLHVTRELYPAPPNTPHEGLVIPFGDGPAPLYPRRVGKTLIQTMLASAKQYVYMTTPYLIIDNDLCADIENAALRGVDVRIVVPHIPDKRLVFEMTRSYYPRLLRAGVKIYEYTPGFIHAKSYLVDGQYAMVGTINLDYRSLVHHFENGVWLYRVPCIAAIREDIEKVLTDSQQILENTVKPTLLRRLFRALVRVFSPLL